MSNTFICTACGKEFIKEWTDEEAEIDFKKEFPDVPIQECVLVCENCYNRLMFISQSLNRMN